MKDYKNLSADEIRKFALNGAAGLRRAMESDDSLVGLDTDHGKENLFWKNMPQGWDYWREIYIDWPNNPNHADAMDHLAAWADTLEADERGVNKQPDESQKIKELEEKVNAAMEEFTGHTVPILKMIEKLTKRVSALESAVNQETSEPEKQARPEKSPWHLEVDFSKDIFSDWRVFAYQGNYGIFNRYMTSQGPFDVPIFQKSWKTHTEAEHVIKAHRMQRRLAQIEKAAREQWADWPCIFWVYAELHTVARGHIVILNHENIDKQRKEQITEIIRLMEGRENLELALKGPWR